MNFFRKPDREKTRAAARIQAVARGRRERRELETRKPVLIKEKEDMAKAAAMIGAAFRGVKTRGQVTVLKGEKQLTDAKTKWGFLEKRSSKRSFIFGSRQVVLWQRKFVRIHDYHFCYTSTAPQKYQLNASNLLGEKRVPLDKITDVMTVEGQNEFILVTPSQQLHFHCLSWVETQSWINTISLLQAYMREEARAGRQAKHRSRSNKSLGGSVHVSGRLDMVRHGNR